MDKLLRKYAEYQQYVWRNEGKSVILQDKITNDSLTIIVMTGEELKKILAHGEAVDVEFKESSHQLARRIYETICSFLNRRGGHVVFVYTQKQAQNGGDSLSRVWNGCAGR